MIERDARGELVRVGQLVCGQPGPTCHDQALGVEHADLLAGRLGRDPLLTECSDEQIGQANGGFQNPNFATYENIVTTGLITPQGQQFGIIPIAITSGNFFSNGVEQDIAVGGTTNTAANAVDLLENEVTRVVPAERW